MAVTIALEDKLVVARTAARAAGQLLRAKLGGHLAVHAKDVRTNLVTEADTASEALIKDLLSRAFPGTLS